MSLYNKYRPTDLNQIKGNEKSIEALEKMLSDKETCPHVILLHGPTGTGKTTIARIIADKLDCRGKDFKEINSADFRGIDTIRSIISQSQFKPMESSCIVWLMDEIHKITSDASNALLKILEDTPTHVYFILCTTEPQKLLPTIKGRCSSFQTTTLSESEMFGLLRRVARDEGETLDKEIYDQIIQDSFGHPRNALQILEQVLAVDDERRLQMAKQATYEKSESIELCRALIYGKNWKTVSGILNGLQNQDAEGVRRHVLSYCQSILLKESNDMAIKTLEAFLEPFFTTGFSGLLYACYSIVKL